MTTLNKVTKLYSPTGLDEDAIQAHLDEQNQLGYYLVCLDNISGWYRFFWAKEQA
jgi:hypothetical protein